ncbi:hypothetical protein Tco_0734218 [Tanacetum coccineum]
MIVDIEDDIMDPVMQCTTLPSHSGFSQKKLVSFVTEIHTLSIDISLRDCLDDGVAASFQRSRIHKPHAHTQAFKVNRISVAFDDVTELVKVGSGRVPSGHDDVVVALFAHEKGDGLDSSSGAGEEAVVNPPRV